MAEGVSQTHLWSVLDQLRSELPAQEMGVALAALLYLRWADFQEAEQEAIAAFDDLDYGYVLPAPMHWRSWHALPANELQEFFAKRLPDALGGLGTSQGNPLSVHLHRIVHAVTNLARLSVQSLDALVHWLADQPFETPADRRILLEVLDAVLDQRYPDLDRKPPLGPGNGYGDGEGYGDGAGGGRGDGRRFHMRSGSLPSGEYRSPRAVVQLIVELAAPVAGERIYDPCFGSAALLTAASDYVLRAEENRFSRRSAPLISVSGVELNSNAYVIGLTRLALAGIDDPQLELGNSLERTASDNPQRDGFDVILADPPMGMRTDPDGLDHFPVRTTYATGLFIQHALSQLRPGGRAVIVVPQGFLFRGGSEQRLRRMLLEQHVVEAVVAMPETTFMPYTAIRASLLVLRRNGPTNRIRMIDAEPLFEKSKGKQPASLRQDMAEALCRSMRSPKAGKHCWDVEVDSLSEADWDFTPKRRDQSGLTGILTSLEPAVELSSLRKCCQILSGRAFKRDQLLDEPPPRPMAPEQEALFPEDDETQKSLFDVPVIPYVRIKDIQQGQATKGSSWLSPNAVSSVDARWKLKTGDVLLSKSGTIGKVGMVRNGAVGAVAANGLFVLRPDQNRLDPHFLWSYLNCNDCRAWLDDRARGATIRHLSKRILDDMPVPLPPLQLQQRVATQHREHGVDVLAFLSQMLIEGEDDPVAEWVDGALRYLTSEKGAAFREADIEPLLHSQVLGGGFTGVRNRVAHHDIGQNALTAWVLALTGAAEALRNSDEMPPGPAFYSLLQQAEHALAGAEAVLTGHLPNENKARELTRTIGGRVAKAMSALTGDTQVEVTCDTDVLKPGEMVSIDLVIKNRSALPIRDVRVSTSPDWGGEKIGYLAEQTSTTISVSGITPREEGQLSLRLAWLGLALDGHQTQGEREIAFNIVDSDAVDGADAPDLGGSPYVCGDPVRPERNDVFFGREELLERIRRQIIQTGNVVLLEGNRRAGKSSVLWHLEGANAVPGWLGVYCSLQGAEGSKEGAGVPTAEVFREIAKSIAKGIQTLGEQTPLPNGDVLPPGKTLGIAKACREGITEESSFTDFRDYAEIALELLGRHDLGLLLMLDEFDKLQEGIDSGITSPQVPENIRFMVQTYRRFSAILTGSRRLKRLREEYWSALYGIGTRFGVTSLPEEAARNLIIEPVKGRLTYSREAVKQAIYLTAGQPYLLQCLCNRIFDMAAQLKTRSVTLDLVNQAGNKLVEDNEHFASLWDYAQTNRRRFILALCHKEATGPDTLNLGVLQEHLLNHGIEVDDDAFIADLEFLRELELVDLVGKPSGGHYALAIPLMGVWIEKQQDFAAVLSKARSETEDQHE